MEQEYKRDKFKYFKDILNGDRYPSDRAKFNFICYAIGGIHLFLCIYYFALSCLLIGGYHFLSAYYYIVILTVWLRKDKYYQVFLASYIEIIFNSIFMTMTLGWSWGFMMYIIAICPVSFFISYSIPGMKRSLTKPVIFASISLLFFIIAKILSGIIPPYLDFSDRTIYIDIIYLFNCIITFVSIIVFSALFALQLRCQEKELEKHNRELTDISSIDPLTKLLNRRAMGECLDTAVEHIKKTGELFSLAIGDIDNFKMVNDIHGHNVGDDVLKMVASTIRESLPEKAILCRWGGEEFLILIRKPEIDMISDIEAVRYAISQQTVKVEKPDGYIDLKVTMTFGVSQYIHGFSIDQVIALADENLYKGKNNGKNRVVHSRTVI